MAVAVSEPVSSATTTATSVVVPAPEREPVADAPAEYVNPISLIKPADPSRSAPMAMAAATPKPSIATPFTASSPFAAISQQDFSSDSDQDEEVEEFSFHSAVDAKSGLRGKVAAIAVALIAVSTVGLFAARKY